MIATLTGKISQKYAEQVVLETAGVGYGVYVSSEDYGKLKTGQDAKLYVYEHIRESSHDLYGFSEPPTKYFFELLLGVNGVGPKMALNILSIGSSSKVAKAIATGDVKFIQTASGVGKKVAQRIVVELKDKVGIEGDDLSGELFTAQRMANKDDAVQALISLGLNASDAISSLNGISKDLPLDKRVKMALKVNN